MKYLTNSGLSYFLNKIKAYLTSSTYLNSIGISNSDIDDIADDAGYSSGSLPASEDIYITGDIIPNTDNSVDLGASSKNIKMIYTKGITINGTQFLPSNYVDLTTAQTIGGVKTFSSEVTMFGRDINLMSRVHYGKNSNPSTTTWQYLYFRGNTANEGYTNSWYGGYIEQVINTNGSARGRWLIRNTDEKAASVELLSSMDDTLTFRPTTNNVMLLGLQSHAWKDCYTNAINGLNPGALSLWSGDYISLDTTKFDVTSTTIGSFASTVDGWATLVIGQKNKPFGIWLIGGTVRESFYSVKNNDDYFIFALIPVRANVNMTIYCTADDIDSTRNVSWLRVSPCQGNV